MKKVKVDKNLVKRLGAAVLVAILAGGAYCYKVFDHSPDEGTEVSEEIPTASVENTEES